MAATEGAEPVAEPKIKLNYIYNICNNIADIRHFYSDLIGLPEQQFMDNYYLNYDLGAFCFMWFQTDTEMPVLDEWTCQPGWAGGVLDTTSWSIEIPYEDYGGVVKALKEGGAPTFAAKPFWAQDSYWSFPVRDPMGNTVEVYCKVKERPESTEWPD